MATFSGLFWNTAANTKTCMLVSRPRQTILNSNPAGFCCRVWCLTQISEYPTAKWLSFLY
jgi:hypothetical protein